MKVFQYLRPKHRLGAARWIAADTEIQADTEALLRGWEKDSEVRGVFTEGLTGEEIYAQGVDIIVHEGKGIPDPRGPRYEED